MSNKEFDGLIQYEVTYQLKANEPEERISTWGKSKDHVKNELQKRNPAMKIIKVVRA